MDTSNYTFLEMRSSEFKVDPVFKSKDFVLFGNPSSSKETPHLFHVIFNGKQYQYCLNNPLDFVKNEEALLKIKRYIIIHDKENISEEPNTFFIGNITDGVEISAEFINQRVILIDYQMIEAWYPKRMEDIYKIIIKFVLAKQKFLGQMKHFGELDDDIIFLNPTLTENEKMTYRRYLQDSMARDGLISIINGGFYTDLFVLTSKGMSLVEEKNNNQNRIAFIAIKFDSNGERIDAIVKAISDAGFEAAIMNRIETNNWIMPEIFHQIENSRFVVADFSMRCEGAYYEAGYAAALKKPVIHLFDKRKVSKTNKLHFDIAQKSTIFYSDYDDLMKRLTNRIKATIK